VDTERVNRLVVASALATVALALLVLGLSTQSARAQGGFEIYVHKQLGRSDPTVYVGQYLTFTIEIRNDAAFPISTLPLSDTFNADVLAYQDAAPCDPDRTGPNWLHWDDLTTCFGVLDPGETVFVVVGFIAEHPAPAIVNHAEVHDAQGTVGLLGEATDVVTGSESVGGSSPVNKELFHAPGTALVPPQVGGPLMFTIVITNSGYTSMTTAPLADTYNPTWLAFNYAEPPPDYVDEVNGILSWADVIASRGTGPVPPHGTISVMAVFTALSSLDDAMANGAEVSGATDWFGNELAGGSDQVPITIIEALVTPSAPAPAPTDTPAPASTATPTAPFVPTQPAHTQPAPTPVIATATPTGEATEQAAVTPAFLPESGQTSSGAPNGGLFLFVLLLIGLGLRLLVRTKPNL
jgi:hypothetical protein